MLKISLNFVGQVNFLDEKVLNKSPYNCFKLEESVKYIKADYIWNIYVYAMSTTFLPSEFTSGYKIEKLIFTTFEQPQFCPVSNSFVHSHINKLYLPLSTTSCTSLNLFFSKTNLFPHHWVIIIIIIHFIASELFQSLNLKKL